MSTTEDKQEGLSKKELKKLAKKEQAKAKKQQQQQQAAAAMKSSTAASSTAATTPALATHVPPKPTLWLVHPSVADAASLKVVWASQLYQVDVTKASFSTMATTASSNNKKKHATLLYGDNNIMKVTGGGNAMAKAIAGMSYSNSTEAEAGASSMMMRDDLYVDEWCEWERTVLRHAASKQQLEAALNHLAAALEVSPTGWHIVGHKDSIADICLVTTLSKLPPSTLSNLPAPVQKYVEAHQNALQAAQQGLEELVAGNWKKEVRLLNILRDIFGNVIVGLFGADVPLREHFVSKCSNPSKQHGDYQCDAAMPLFAALKNKGTLPADIQSPQQVAAAIVQALGTDHPVVMDLSTQGPGFVLCRIRPAVLEYHVNAFLQHGRLPFPSHTPETCVVDFSSPNIAKEMHVGHLRSTIIGESVCRILEAVGHKVYRVNHVGDWGTQFGMLIQYLKEEYPTVGQDDNEELPNITDLTVFYKSAKERFDDNAEFKKMAQQNVVKLQSGDAECVKIWHMLCDVSRREFQKVYDRLDVTVEECGESFYNDKIPPVIAEFEQAGKIRIEEGGAKCVFVDDFKIPLMLQKSDGGFGYDSTDMAALKYRLFELNADRIIVITDSSQENHFKMVYAAGRDIGWVVDNDDDKQLQHIGFGTVMGEDGKRFKTRSGHTVRLVDLLDEAVSRMEAILRERIAEGKANITEDEVHEVAEAIGYGAVKYFDLRRKPTSNYQFSYENMLDTKGETAVYLLYARVRLESICAKAKAEYNVDVEDLLKSGEKIVISHESERNLALQLQVFADVIEHTLEDLYPQHICEYVYKLANAASDFVTQCKVLGSPEMNSRLLFCHATTVAMHQCFDLLGIRHVKRI